MKTQTFAAVIHKEEDLYLAECPEVGTVSQGYRLEEAIANLKEATELYRRLTLRTTGVSPWVKACQPKAGSFEWSCPHGILRI